jgi:UDP-glucose 4-epimerase
VNADLTPSALKRLMTVMGPPELLVHAAGGSSVSRSIEDPHADFLRTVGTAAAVLDFVRTHAPRAVVVYPSSAAVYGSVGAGKISEESVLSPVSPYGVHKQLVEQLFALYQRQFGTRCRLIRFFSLYGPGLRKQVIWDLAQKLASRPVELSLAGTGEETRDFLHVEDAACLITLVGERVDEAPFVINGGTGQSVTVRQVVEQFIATAKLRTKIRFTGLVRPGDPVHYEADTAKASTLGYRPMKTWPDGLREYLEWTRLFGLPGQICA